MRGKPTVCLSETGSIVSAAPVSNTAPFFSMLEASTVCMCACSSPFLCCQTPGLTPDSAIVNSVTKNVVAQVPL